MKRLLWLEERRVVVCSTLLSIVQQHDSHTAGRAARDVFEEIIAIAGAKQAAYLRLVDFLSSHAFDLLLLVVKINSTEKKYIYDRAVYKQLTYMRLMLLAWQTVTTISLRRAQE